MPGTDCQEMYTQWDLLHLSLSPDNNRQIIGKTNYEHISITCNSGCIMTFLVSCDEFFSYILHIALSCLPSPPTDLLPIPRLFPLPFCSVSCVSLTRVTHRSMGTLPAATPLRKWSLSWGNSRLHCPLTLTDCGWISLGQVVTSCIQKCHSHYVVPRRQRSLTLPLSLALTFFLSHLPHFGHLEESEINVLMLLAFSKCLQGWLSMRSKHYLRRHHL